MSELDQTTAPVETSATTTNVSTGIANDQQMTSNNNPLTTAMETPQGKTGAWFESIADESLRGYVESKGFKGVEDVISSYKQAETLLGDKVNATIIPGPDATPEQWNEFYNKVGRPSEASEYKLEVLEGDDGSFSKTAAEWMHQAGLNPQQAQTLNKHWNEFISNQQAALQQQRQVQYENELSSLKQEWAQNYDRNVELAQRAARALGVQGEMSQKLIDAMGIKFSMELFSKVGSGFSEHAFHGSGTQPSAFGMSVEAARARQQDIMKSTELRTKYISGDPTLRNEMDTLNRIIAGVSK